MVDGDSSDSDEYEEDDSSPMRCKVSVEIKSRDLPNTARANAVLRVGPWLSKPGDEYSRFPSSKPELIFTYRDAQPHVVESWQSQPRLAGEAHLRAPRWRAGAKCGSR